MKRFAQFLFLTSSMVAWIGCSTIGDQPQAASRTDADVERTINNRIRQNPALAEAKVDVDADMDKRTVTVSGTVKSQTERTQVVQIVRNAEPSFTLNDKIDVMPGEVPFAEYTDEMARTTRERAQKSGEKLGESLEDAWLHTKVTAKLTMNGTTPARKINVDVVNNVVTLRGDVDSATAKREAERIASETDGVRKVINLLKVQA